MRLSSNPITNPAAYSHFSISHLIAKVQSCARMIHCRICIPNIAVRRPWLCALIPLRWSPFLPPHREDLGPQGPKQGTPIASLRLGDLYLFPAAHWAGTEFGLVEKNVS